MAFFPLLYTHNCNFSPVKNLITFITKAAIGKKKKKKTTRPSRASLGRRAKEQAGAKARGPWGRAGWETDSGGVRSGGPECPVPETGSDAPGKGGLAAGRDRARRERRRASRAPGGLASLLARLGHRERGQSGQRAGAHRHLLVGFHAIQHHLDDLPAQLDALL